MATSPVVSTSECSPGKTFVLPRDVPAFGGLPSSPAEARLGMLTKLSCGAQVMVTGEGFNGRTVKVQLDGVSYFVFRRDLVEDDPDSMEL